MLAPKQNLPADQHRLLKLYKAIDGPGRESLLAFAEFLLQRTELEPKPPEPLPEPIPIARPERESVVAAIKRLSKTYHMLDRSTLFTETSSLMTAHIMQGRPAPEVIDELQTLFETHYRKNYLGT